MNSSQSLDEQYLRFNKKTCGVFSEFPQIEPLRFYIFTELLTNNKYVNWSSRARFYLRSLVHHPKTIIDFKPAKILIWMDSSRDIVRKSLLPVYKELMRRGITAQIVAKSYVDSLPQSTGYFKFSTPILKPKWANLALKEFYRVIPSANNRLFKQSFIQQCMILEGRFREIDRLLEVIRPEIVLNASNRNPSGVSAIIRAKKRKILTVELQHGCTQPFHTPIVTDFFLSWGQSSNDTLAELNMPKEKLVITGSPRHDLMMPSSNGEAKQILLEMFSLPDRPTFVFFSNGNDLSRNGKAPAECALWLEYIAIKFKGKINVIVRLHPNESGVLYKNCLHLIVTKNNPDLSITLNGSDWVGSLCSTVLYEALICNKTIWQFYKSDWPDLADNWKRGLALRISSQSELSLKVTEILSDGLPNFDTKITSRAFANLGRSSKAIVDFIETQLSN